MKVLIRGAGDLASGIALRLWRCGLKIIMTDMERPTSIRRTVSFSDAVLKGSAVVEEAAAYMAHDVKEALNIVDKGNIAVIVDPEMKCLMDVQPDVIVDAILAKKNTGTKINDAPVVIGVGPGFTAGIDCSAVVETMRGHDLGRVFYSGSSCSDTGIPGDIAGHTYDRILRAPADGIFKGLCNIGDTVKAGDTVGTVCGIPMITSIDGIVRGLLEDGVSVTKGMKAGDVDPRGEAAYCRTVSDKANAVAGGVLEAILYFTEELGRNGK